MKRHHIIQIIFALISVIFIIAPIIKSQFTANPSINFDTILVSIGCSILSMVIINIVEYNIYLPEVRTTKIIDNWKLTTIFETRQEMNSVTNSLLDSNVKELDISAQGASGLISHKGERLKELLNSKLKMRILVPQRDSYFVKQREIDEKTQTGSITTSIDNMIAWAKKIKKENPNADIIIKEYSCLPTESIMRIDKDLFTGPFMFNKQSQLTMAYQYKSGGSGYSYYSDYFDAIWNNDSISTEVNLEP